LRETDYCLSDNEPFHLDHLERYLIKQELLAEELAAEEPFPSEVFEARGVLPPGVLGELQLRSMRTQVQALAQIVQNYASGRKDEPVGIDLELETFSLTGKIGSLYGGRNVHFRTAKLNPKDHLRAWIEHLALCAAGAGQEPRTVLIGKDAVVTFSHVPEAHTALQTLSELFWQGVTQPLPFFPASAMAFVEAQISRQGDPFKKAHDKWDGAWRKDRKRKGEKDDRFIACCFDDSNPLDDRFVQIANMVFEPMLQHETREEL
jgi:exodeoxyribonuclease V gamma subunit